MDAAGRLRLDTVVRYLQDVAIDDVDETGWGAPEHLWVVRWYRIDVVEPFLVDRDVRLTTWCSAQASVAAGRRTTVRGDRGGLIEADSVWIHLDASGRPTRLADFGVYTASTGGRLASTRLRLPDPPRDAPRTAWQLRSTDVDLMGHVNNAVHWAALEQALPDLGLDATRPFRLILEYRHAIDLGEDVSLAAFFDDGRVALGLVSPAGVKAVARLEQPPA